MADIIEIEGTVDTIVYTNEDNGYTVSRLSLGDELIVIVGYMPYLAVGESVSVRGCWDVHPNFGRQFKVEFYEKKLPTGLSSIYKYLASGAIRGIGPVTAERIVQQFGEEAFDVIEKNPEWLLDIKGITKKRMKQINESYNEQYGMRSVMVFCSTYFGPSLAVKIYKRYGAAAIDIIKLNPYMLVDEIDGISFLKADRIAKDLGFLDTCNERAQAGIKYVLQQAMYRDGHCYLPEDELAAQTAKQLSVSVEELSPVIKTMLEEKMLFSHEIEGKQAIYSSEMELAEQYTAEKLLLLDKAPRLSVIENIQAHISSLEKSFGYEYAPEQRKAITYAASNGVTIVTGGPGTGKTTVIKAMIDIFSELGISFSLCAPTGRAAKRMTEASGHEAKTIHRLLEMDFSASADEPKFMRNEENPLPCNALIIDEMSMVDTLLMAALLKAVKIGAYLIIIGDSDQLPSVGPGNVLGDIIACECFNVVKLTHIFRQASESLIITNAHAVNHGEMPELNCKTNDFFFLENNDMNNLSRLLCDLCTTRLPKTYNIDNLDDIQIITPTRRGTLGTYGLNRLLQSVLNPHRSGMAEKRFGDIVYRVNDKVMQTKNNYNIQWYKDGQAGEGIFNGDIGRIKDINLKAETMTIDFDGRLVEYDFAFADELEHAYAITVHKSQGSEYPFVLLVLLGSPPMLRTRNLLYTAITRAQKMVIACGSKEVLCQMVENNRRSSRYTGLVSRIASAK